MERLFKDGTGLRRAGWVMAAALMVFRLTPGIAQPGMFFDGLTYATISRNLAEGHGDFWNPVFSPGGPAFREQPPLAFWLESLLFRALGDHYWVEKLYSALTGVASAVVIAAIWRAAVGGIGARGDGRRDEGAEQARPADFDWWPVALWAVLPGWGWMYENNMLENTLGLFTLLAVWRLVRAGTSRLPDGIFGGEPASSENVVSSGKATPGRRGLQVAAALVAAALATVGAVLSKGPVGLFPLAAPALVVLVLWRDVTLPSRALMAVVGSGLMTAFFVAAMAAIFAQPAAAAFLREYWHGQVVASLAGQREHVSSVLGRLDIVLRIATQIAVPAVVGWCVAWWARRVARQESSLTLRASRDRSRLALLFLATGLGASLPIVLSPKQSGHYAFPSYAFYVLAIAVWRLPEIQILAQHYLQRGAAVQRRWAYGSWGMIGACVVVSLALSSRPHRDREIYADTQVIGRIVPAGSTVGLAPELAADWPLQSYLARDHRIAAAPRIAGQEFVVATRDEAPAGYAAVGQGMRKYRLFRRAEERVAERKGPESGKAERQSDQIDRTGDRIFTNSATE